MERENEITVFLADDHAIVRKGLRSLLEHEFGIKVIGEAEDGLEAVKKVEELLPKILILDISLPLLNGLEVARQLIKRCPEIKIIVLSMYDTEELVFETLHAGVKGYIVKKSAPEQLISAIRSVSLGKSFFSPEIAEIIGTRMIEKFPDELPQTPSITEREIQILQLVAEGHSNREMAKILQISIKTVENHRAKIMEKLNFKNITDLIRYAISKDIIKL
ncbi:MAG: TRAP-type C4-dicarboxylate transporter, periplasmic solute-binding protein [uncultured bacterium]|nr:MAG: TRAP-type C4-dicarboxylate transporter, periplasmic solute-binding protein [uncultured bacterium]HBY02548.1 DNA-binding response regulator [Rikenellaceae bacterium]